MPAGYRKKCLLRMEKRKRACIAAQVWYNSKNQSAEEAYDKNFVYLPRQDISKIFKVLDIPYFFVVGRCYLLPTYYFFIIYASTRYKFKN